MIGLRGRHDPFAAGELHARLETRGLVVRRRFDQDEIHDMRYQRPPAGLAKPSRVKPRRHERGAQRVHLHQWREVTRIAEVVGVFAARETRARRWLHRDDTHLLAAAQLRADERKGNAGKVRSTTGAGDDDVWVV